MQHPRGYRCYWDGPQSVRVVLLGIVTFLDSYSTTITNVIE